MITREQARQYRRQMVAGAKALTDEEALEVPLLYERWQPGQDYAAGTRLYHEGTLYRVLQDHRSQEDWTPGAAPSLFTEVLIPDPEVIPVWVQPDSTNAYVTGDKVHFPTAEDPVYESLIDGNVWSPAAYPGGWRLIG